jgi:beta-phosphoglucomutase-like phosphatase (HAD superfamily)
MLPRTPAAVVFDMDGLLFDTEALYQEAILLAAAEGGHAVAGDVFNRTVGLPWAQSRALLRSHFGETFPVDEFQAAWVRHFWVIADTRLTLKPGALELLARWTGCAYAVPSRAHHPGRPSNDT